MKVGVIGTGVMGENHVRVFSSMIHDCQFIGVYDRDAHRRNEVAKTYHCQAFSSIEALLKEVDCVSIAVPTRFHYEVGLTCIEHGVHFLMEKPITNTVKEAADLIKRAKEKNVMIQVGHIELFNPTIQILQTILSREDIISIDVHRMGPFQERNLQVDVVQDLMIHDMYILNHLLQDEVDTFYAMGKKFDGTTKHAVVISKYKRGTLAQLTASFKTEEKVRTIHVTTNEAYIQADLLDRKILITRSTNFSHEKDVKYKQQNIVEKIMIPDKEPLKMQFHDFLTSVREKRPPTVSGEDGLNILKITNQISDYIRAQYDQ